MMISKPIKGTLVFFCGKMGAGKSTLSRQIAKERRAVLLSEDEWLASVYGPDRITSLTDYIEHSNRLKPPMKKLVQSILDAGTDVVMDYPANTIAQRKWFQGIFSEVSAAHDLMYLDVEDSLCLKRIAKRRREEPERAKTDTPEMFAQVTKYFEPPTEDEGFTITWVNN
ncbi:cell division protein ZipA [Seminavis robusta]|uniref:Cell division protein ZipA n=1 Tax=Seminavis robusta TaxID=568900 RepID=A0A9N8DMQ2_9STRA|nr:cell division protein ZipA [Seminavis robusta]|eukprot:Sro163_g073390.1 cell division protein ZipA (169) ;mRNA; r:96390-96896